ncbi:Uncharacterised protein [Shigella sonnei]|nr:Uncharacterised protein [Shigella sonnei]
MGIAAAAGVGVPAQRVLHLRFVQRVVQLGNRRCRITKCRMSSDVFHSLAIDIDLATILQAFQILFPGERTLGTGAEIFWFHVDLYSINRNTIVNFVCFFCYSIEACRGDYGKTLLGQWLVLFRSGTVL